MNYKNQYAQKFARQTLAAYIYPDAERITLCIDSSSKRLLLRVADECENEMLCSKTVVEADTLFLLWPDYGICGDDKQLKDHLCELFDAENYELVFKN